MSKSELLARLRARLDHPSTADEIIRRLRVPRLQRPAVKRHLRALVGEGELALVRGHLYAWPRKAERRPGATPPARHVIGRFERDRLGQGYVVPFDRKAADDVLVPRRRRAAPARARWSWSRSSARPRLDSRRGPRRRSARSRRRAGRRYRHHHPQARDPRGARAGGARRRRAPRPRRRRAGAAGRTDFRDRIVVTIDGEHARDFDDAVSIERLPNGHFRLGVHIADVAHYVPEGSALDREALERGTSVYFPERAVHMFPEALATGVCSLNPQVDRLVQSCLMEITRRGDVVHIEMHDGVIRSTARLTYTDVNAVLAAGDADVRGRLAPLVPTSR